MRSDKFSDLPDWDDHAFYDEEEGDEWRPNPVREACKTLFNKWQQVVFLLNGIVMPFLDNEDDDAGLTFAARDMFADAHLIGAKIKRFGSSGYLCCSHGECGDHKKARAKYCIVFAFIPGRFRC